MTTLGSRLGGGIAVLSLAAQTTISGCESHRLTRSPSSDTSHLWALVWVAAAALIAVLAIGAVVLIRRRPGIRRLIGGASWMALAATAAFFAGVLFFMVARREQLMPDGGCREVPIERRPESLVTISCGDVELELYGSVFFASVAGAAGVLGAVALKAGPGYQWLPGGVAAIIALAATRAALDPAGGHGDSQLSLLVVALSAPAALCLLAEFRTWIVDPQRKRGITDFGSTGSPPTLVSK